MIKITLTSLFIIAGSVLWGQQSGIDITSSKWKEAIRKTDQIFTDFAGKNN